MREHEELIKIFIDDVDSAMVRKLSIEELEWLEGYYYDQWNFEKDTLTNKLLMNKAERLRKQAIKQMHAIGPLQQQNRVTATQAAQMQQQRAHAMQQMQHAMMNQFQATQNAIANQLMNSQLGAIVRLPSDDQSDALRYMVDQMGAKK